MNKIKAGDYEALSEVFGSLTKNYELSVTKSSVDIKESIPKSLLGADPMTSNDEQINKMMDLSIANVKNKLAEQHLDYRDRTLHETLSEKSLEKAFLLWEVDGDRNKQPFAYLLFTQINLVMEDYFKTANSKQVLERKGRAVFLTFMDEYGLEATDEIVTFEISETAFETANTEHDKLYNNINRESYEEFYLDAKKQRYLK